MNIYYQKFALGLGVGIGLMLTLGLLLILGKTLIPIRAAHAGDVWWSDTQGTATTAVPPKMGTPGMPVPGAPGAPGMGNAGPVIDMPQEPYIRHPLFPYPDNVICSAVISRAFVVVDQSNKMRAHLGYSNEKGVFLTLYDAKSEPRVGILLNNNNEAVIAVKQPDEQLKILYRYISPPAPAIPPQEKPQ